MTGKRGGLAEGQEEGKEQRECNGKVVRKCVVVFSLILVFVFSPPRWSVLLVLPGKRKEAAAVCLFRGVFLFTYSLVFILPPLRLFMYV